MRHPDPDLLRARLRDLADLGLPKLAATLELVNERDDLARGVINARGTFRDTPAPSPAIADRKAAILVVLDDIADDLIDALACDCSRLESCSACETRAQLKLAKAPRVPFLARGPFDIGAAMAADPTLAAAERLGASIGEAIAANRRRMTDHLFRLLAESTSGPGIKPPPAEDPAPRYIQMAGRGERRSVGKSEARGPITLEQLRAIREELGTSPGRPVASPDVFEEVVRYRPDLAAHLDADPTLPPATWIRSRAGRPAFEALGKLEVVADEDAARLRSKVRLAFAGGPTSTTAELEAAGGVISWAEFVRRQFAAQGIPAEALDGAVESARASLAAGADLLSKFSTPITIPAAALEEAGLSAWPSLGATVLAEPCQCSICHARRKFTAPHLGEPWPADDRPTSIPIVTDPTLGENEWYMRGPDTWPAPPATLFEINGPTAPILGTVERVELGADRVSAAVRLTPAGVAAFEAMANAPPCDDDDDEAENEAAAIVRAAAELPPLPLADGPGRPDDLRGVGLVVCYRCGATVYLAGDDATAICRCGGPVTR